MTTLQRRLPGLTASVPQSRDAANSLRIIVEQPSPTGSLIATVLRDGFYYDISGQSSFRDVAPGSLLTIPTEAIFSLLRKQQDLVGEYPRLLEERVLFFVVGELLARHVGNPLAAGKCWETYAEINHLDEFVETSPEMLQHRRCFAGAWHHVEDMITPRSK
jgi:hypothetical protein